MCQVQLIVITKYMIHFKNTFVFILCICLNKLSIHKVFYLYREKAKESIILLYIFYY